MTRMIYHKNPGYLIDLIYTCNLYFNKDYCSIEHVNRDKLYADVEFFKGVVNRFSPFSDEFSPFFTFKGKSADFITEKYLLNQISAADDFNFESFTAKLADKQLFLANLSDFFFDDYKQQPLSEISKRIGTLPFTEAVKHRLLAFYISPDEVINRLIGELKAKEAILRRYYEENYEALLKVQSSIAAEQVGSFFELEDDLENCHYTLCLLSKNLLGRINAGSQQVLTLGVDYADAIACLRSISERPDLVKFGKILSEENRVRIIEMINQRHEMCTSDIAKNLSSSATVIYYHLEMMSDAKLLNARSEGRTVYYSLNRDYFRMFAEDIGKYVR